MSYFPAALLPVLFSVLMSGCLAALMSDFPTALMSDFFAVDVSLFSLTRFT